MHLTPFPPPSQTKKKQRETLPSLNLESIGPKVYSSFLSAHMDDIEQKTAQDLKMLQTLKVFNDI